MRLAYLVCSIFLLLPNAALAATYYVDASRSNDSGSGTAWETAKKTISAGIALMAGGDTLVIRSGTYSGDSNRINNPPSGSSGAYTTIKAETDGGVIVTGQSSGYYPCNIDVGRSYIKVQGIKFFNTVAPKCYIQGDHIKIISCASDGAGGNTSSFLATGQYILFEDCYAYGCGRYPFGAFGAAKYVIFRRCVVRWDYSNTAEPQACFASYDVSYVYFQNCIAIDGKDVRGTDSTYDGIKGFFTPNGANNIGFDGCIALNLEGGGFYIEESPIVNVHIKNCVAWDCKNAGQKDGEGYDAWLFYSRYDASGGPLTLDHDTFGVCDLGEGIIQYEALPNDSIRNSIIYGITLNSGRYALEGFTTEDYNCFYGNTAGRNGNFGSHSITNVNPLTNSLKYLVRIEDGSSLDSRASDGTDIGATVMKRIGTSGSLYGDSGWNTLTADNLWPFPNEDAMRTDMRSFYLAANALYAGSPAVDGKRGFCADGKTLSNYIWEYLNNTMTLASPSGLTISVLSPTSVALGWTDNCLVEEGFKIERKSGTSTYSEIGTVGANVFIYVDSAVPQGVSTYYRVCAYDNTGTSSYSNEVWINADGTTGTSDSSSRAAEGSSGGGGGGGGGGCFIATAAYGTPFADEVVSLKRLRDEHLVRTRAGRIFVAWYNRFSPPIADYIRNRPWARCITRACIKPLVLVANIMESNRLR